MTKDSHGKKQATGSASAKRSGEPLVLVKENRLAHAAVTRLALAPADDPVGLVYLYGPSGVGKSHFVRHFVREAHRQAPGLRLLTATTSEFVASLSEAFARDGQAEFEAQHSGVDLLVLEDLAAIQGRAAAQRMLVVILDELKRSGGRVMVTCTSLPGQLKNIIPRLASRLRGGLCAPMELLDEASRLNFAKHFAASRQIPISSQAAELLARRGPATPREILAALVNLDLDTRRNGRDSDATLVEAQLNAAKCATRPVADADCQGGRRVLRCSAGTAPLVCASQTIGSGPPGRHALGARVERTASRGNRPLLRAKESYNRCSRLPPHARPPRRRPHPGPRHRTASPHTATRLNGLPRFLRHGKVGVAWCERPVESLSVIG